LKDGVGVGVESSCKIVFLVAVPVHLFRHFLLFLLHSHSAQRHRQTDRQTDRQRDNSMMPAAVRSAKSDLQSHTLHTGCFLRVLVILNKQHYLNFLTFTTFGFP